MTTSAAATGQVPWWKEPTKDQWLAWVAAWLGYAYGASADRVKPSAMIEQLNHESLHGYVPPFNLAIVYLGMGDRERALDGLEKAYAAHSQWMTFLKMDRIFGPLRSEPRFTIRRKTFPPYFCMSANSTAS